MPRSLQGDNDRLKSEVSDLRNQHNQLRDQVAALPKPLSEQQTQTIAHTEAIGAVDEAQRRNKDLTWAVDDLMRDHEGRSVQVQRIYDESRRGVSG